MPGSSIQAPAPRTVLAPECTRSTNPAARAAHGEPIPNIPCTNPITATLNRPRVLLYVPRYSYRLPAAWLLTSFLLSGLLSLSLSLLSGLLSLSLALLSALLSELLSLTLTLSLT